MEAREEASFCLPPSGDVTLPCFVQNLQARVPPIPWEPLAQLLLRKAHTYTPGLRPRDRKRWCGARGPLTGCSFLFKADLAAPGDGSWSSGPINPCLPWGSP